MWGAERYSKGSGDKNALKAQGERFIDKLKNWMKEFF
jgi:hypothetical protein